MRKEIKKIFCVLFALCAASFSASAQPEASDLKIPAEVSPFIERGTKAIALETADLNGDGRGGDFVLVLERSKTKRDKYDLPINQRPLLILVRQPDNSLKLAGRNEKAVFCASCGGVFGDPFASIEAGRNTFTVNLYGGSNWRWTESYTFNYSRRDKTWQLIRIESGSFHVFEPNKVKKKITTPKKFGKINLADFDPEKFS